MGLWGSDSTKKTTTTIATTIQKDLRTDLSGAAAGQVAAGGSVASGGGSLAFGAGDYGTISTSIADLKMGMTGAEVKDLLAQTGDVFKETASGVMDYARSAISSTQAAQTGGLGDLQRYIPHIVIGLVVVAMWRARK
jgi:hypothetical protein